ncbi:MAG: hypothetical protein HYZ92_06075 [Candidatus Omnitrophica bacterium]|nr:hypothetical protein [Candidatus Omnitrophota bacterium]
MEQATLSEYQDALRYLLLYVMHHPKPNPTKSAIGECRVLWALPKLVDIVAKGHGDPSAVEHEAIRTQMCSQCEYQDADGYCPLRASGDCCLSREEGRVIAVIRRTLQRQGVAPDSRIIEEAKS